ncbi:hypothetical protein M9H77_07758 [Catharanthus roseus]|uniref:Uncharacterized protein n=1 Tax=Catharanthus roseus TaxID=4058 RepID=A0ACC0BVV1_CATRO|nr:hypothetical protein M9H77_07758 [Catharanthus roseus]
MISWDECKAKQPASAPRTEDCVSCKRCESACPTDFLRVRVNKNQKKLVKCEIHQVGLLCKFSWSFPHSTNEDQKRREGRNRVICYECHEPGHIKTFNPKLKRKIRLSKEKGMAAEAEETWSGSETTGSDEEDDLENQEE